MIDWLTFKLFRLDRFEEKLKKYNGYRDRSTLRWKKQMVISWRLTQKVLREIKILTAIEIRHMLREVVEQHKNLFSSANCYICKFGKPGKSGDIILYEFCHGCSEYKDRIIEPWRIPSLPEKSRIVFLDDLVGSGQQSVEYISNTINLFLNSSHKAFLLSLCATPQGLEHVKTNTNFDTICHLILNEEEYQHYSSQSYIFNEKERALMMDINDRLKGSSNTFFDKGLLIAFYYAVPNNTMPFIWKDNYNYLDKEGSSKNWFALLPRKY